MCGLSGWGEGRVGVARVSKKWAAVGQGDYRGRGQPTGGA